MVLYRIKLLFNLLRGKQWVKNIFMIFPLIFSGHFTELKLWCYCAWGIAAFCLVSSGMYIINDFIDLKEDRLHSQKSKRPLAAGLITTVNALIIAITILILGQILSWELGLKFFIFSSAYIFLNVVYNLWTNILS